MRIYMSQDKKKVYPERGRRVFVGISGGVDSATSAAILKRDGYDVTGVFIKIWSPEWSRCSMQDDRRDAMRVCAALDIPYREIDCTEEYKKEVIEPMIDAYKKGDVPNPDVFCNRYIKFGTFFGYAMREGADFVATGHYARVMCHEARNINQKEKENASLIRVAGHMTHDCCVLRAACDMNKDQTYFLWTLTQKELAKTLFPVGHLKKDDVRKLAKKLGVPVAEKKDSQGLCFLGDYGVDEFLATYIKSEQGDVLNEKGDIIGHHGGVHFLTLGSRHGFSVTRHGTNAKPLYIVQKDVSKNTITVSEHLAVSKKMITLTESNWIEGKCPADSHLLARSHHREQLFPVEVAQKGDWIEVTLYEDHPPISPGQSIVFYKDEVCLGGGIIM